MRFSSLLLALSATALAQDNSSSTTTTTTVQVQGLTGVANLLGQFAQSFQGQQFDVSAIQKILPKINGILQSFVPSGATFGDLAKLLLSPNLQVPAQAYALIPPGVLTGPEYFVALQAAPQVVSLVQSDIASFVKGVPSSLPLTDLGNFIAQNSKAVGSAISAVIQTALPQASSLLIQLESSAVGIPEPTSLCPGVSSATATAAPGTTVTAGSQTTASIAIPTRTGNSSAPTPTIVTGAADKVFVGHAVAIGGAVMAAAVFL